MSCSARYPPEARTRRIRCSEVPASGEPISLRGQRGRGALSHAAVDEEHLALYRAWTRCRYIVVPLRGARPAARDDLAGHRVSPGGASGRPISSCAHEIARRAALAIDNARALRRRAGVVRAAQHAARLGAGGIGFWDRRPPLRPGATTHLPWSTATRRSERRPRIAEEVIRRSRPTLLPLYRRGTRELGEPLDAHRVDRRRRAWSTGAAASLALRATTPCTRPRTR